MKVTIEKRCFALNKKTGEHSFKVDKKQTLEAKEGEIFDFGVDQAKFKILRVKENTVVIIKGAEGGCCNEKWVLNKEKPSVYYKPELFGGLEEQYFLHLDLE